MAVGLSSGESRGLRVENGSLGSDGEDAHLRGPGGGEEKGPAKSANIKVKLLWACHWSLVSEFSD